MIAHSISDHDGEQPQQAALAGVFADVLAADDDPRQPHETEQDDPAVVGKVDQPGGL